MGEKYSNKRLREIIGILGKYNVVTGMTPENLKMLLEDLGPTFVKFGQLLSMQPTILPVEYCRELAKLRTDVAPMRFDEVKSILETEYGTELNEIFTGIEADPLGSASIAQVHLARLAEGERVVIKVQRSGIYETMSQDIFLLKKAAKIIKFVARIGNEIDIGMVIDEMWDIAKQEMDFTIEAENAKEFHANNADAAYITCPRIMENHSTARVLVMEHIDGFSLSDPAALTDNGYDLSEIAEKLAYNYVKQVIGDGFFHADPHSGNVLIRDGKIVWIDLGMMGRLSSRDKKLFSGAIVAIANNDVSGLTEFVLTIGAYRDRVSYTALSSDIEILLHRHAAVDFGDMDLVQMTEDFLSVLREHKISMPKGITMLLRGMATIQGTLRGLCPEINLIEILAGYMSGDLAKNLDLKRELKSILKSLNYSFKKSLDIPAQISDSLKMLSKGTSKVNMELNMSEEMNARMDRLVNKLVVAIIIAALLMGSSLICTTDMYPKILGIPALGILGFFAAFILGAWMLLSIVKKS